VLDLGLPFVDGTLVLHEIQQRVDTQAIPIIVVTGRSGTLEHLAAQCILRKPVDGKTLVQAVRECLHR
jgi:DNA-binding response OmpR family regulator